MRIRTLTPEDFRFAVALTDKENWGYVESDFERLLGYEPDGCFIAEDDGTPVGITTTTSYGRVAWIGNVIVEPDCRDKGIGERLVRHAMDYLESLGVGTIQLTSYVDTVAFYESLGFEAEFPVLSMSVDTTRFTTEAGREAKREDLDKIAAFDASCFGGDRSRVIRQLWEDFPQLVLMSERGPFGYVIGFCTRKTCEIGPLIVESGDRNLAERLLRGALNAVLAERARVFIPTWHENPVLMAESLGFVEDFRTVRMRCGGTNREEKLGTIFAIGALEKG